MLEGQFNSVMLEGQWFPCLFIALSVCCVATYGDLQYHVHVIDIKYIKQSCLGLPGNHPTRYARGAVLCVWVCPGATCPLFVCHWPPGLFLSSLGAVPFVSYASHCLHSEFWFLPAYYSDDDDSCCLPLDDLLDAAAAPAQVLCRSLVCVPERCVWRGGGGVAWVFLLDVDPAGPVRPLLFAYI